MPQTMFARIWSQHQVLARDDGQVLLYVDRHFIHDVSAVAFAELRRRGLRMRAPHRTFGTPDHYVPTASRDYATIGDPEKRVMAQALIADSAAAGVTSLALDDPRQGIVHVVGPEQGLSWPGTLIVCADSHTSTHGALGALAFGIGATEMTHVLATQSLWQRRPKTMRIAVDGRLGHGVSRSDIRALLRIHSPQGLSAARNFDLTSHSSIVRSVHFLDSLQTEIVTANAHHIAGLHFDVLFGLKACDQGDADNKHRNSYMSELHSVVTAALHA